MQMTALKKFLNQTANDIFEAQMRRAAERICAQMPVTIH
jgi:hypothetical protein